MVTPIKAQNGFIPGELRDFPERARRLSDKLLISFHQACEQEDYEIAGQLLHVLESTVSYRSSSWDAKERRTATTVVAAYERLWHARHSGTPKRTAQIR